MAMLKNPGIKYRPFPQVDLPDRQWPSRTITKAPRWLSTDMRDGNQSLIDPMDADKKARFFDLLVKVGLKEIEVGFPARVRPNMISSGAWSMTAAFPTT
jgi:2-isopropylmalate synthase